MEKIGKIEERLPSVDMSLLTDKGMVKTNI
jgi:hypothetical protein